MARVIKIKKCTKCGNEYPATLDYFHKDLTKKDGLHSWCKNCKLEKDRIRLKNNYTENKEYFALKEKNRRDRIIDTLGVRLSTIHDYIRKLKPKPDLCPICCNNEKLELSSIGHGYTKNLEDWMYLCRSCHTVLDRTISEKSVKKSTVTDAKRSVDAASSPSRHIHKWTYKNGRDRCECGADKPTSEADSTPSKCPKCEISMVDKGDKWYCVKCREFIQKEPPEGDDKE